MQPDPTNILSFISTTKRTFIIPPFQRRYVWKKASCITLFDDLKEIITHKQDHYFGNVVYYALHTDFASGYSELSLIDGQQRITTIMLLLIALRDAENNPEVQGNLENTYIKNGGVNENNRIKLKQIESDRVLYEKLIDNLHNQMTSDDKKSPLYINYKYFLTQVKSYATTDILEALSRLTIVALDLQLDSSKQAESPQVIFESINSTGEPLTTSELLCNFLLMGIPTKEQEKYYKNYWRIIEDRLSGNTVISTFLNIYLQMKIGKQITAGTEYKFYKQQYQGFTDDCKTGIEDLAKYSLYYSYILHPDQVKTINKELFLKLNELRELQAKSSYPLVMWLLEETFNEQSALTYSECATAIDIIIAFIFRARISGFKTSGSFDRLLNSLIYKLEKKEPSEYSSTIHFELSNCPTNDFYANDDVFIEHFIEFPLYGSKTQLTKYVFKKLEHAINKNGVLDIDSIEHIMPQNLTPEWIDSLGDDAIEIYGKYLNTIGNITPLNQSDNSHNQDDLFEIKRPTFLESSWKLTRQLQKYTHWSKDTILDRAKELAQIAIKTWQSPLPRERMISDTGSDARVFPADISDTTFYFKDPNGLVEASLQVVDDDQFVVAAGSTIHIEINNDSSKKTISNKRENAKKQGWDGNPLLNCDIQFESPSAAAGFVAGGARNGWVYWEDADGRLLDDYASSNED
jgi:uncharacterized protein with ParB-like and HNH nuclease domain